MFLMNMDASYAYRFSKVFKFYNTIILLIFMISTLDLVAAGNNYSTQVTMLSNEDVHSSNVWSDSTPAFTTNSTGDITTNFTSSSTAFSPTYSTTNSTTNSITKYTTVVPNSTDNTTTSLTTSMTVQIVLSSSSNSTTGFITNVTATSITKDTTNSITNFTTEDTTTSPKTSMTIQIVLSTSSNFTTGFITNFISNSTTVPPTDSTTEYTPNSITNSTTDDTTTSPTTTTPFVLSTPSSSTTTTEYSTLSCPALNGSNYKVNTTENSDGTVVRVQCIPPYQFVTYRTPPDIFVCSYGIWLPSSPSCKVLDSGPSYSVPIIVGCTIGGFICLLIVAGAIYFLCKLKKDQKQVNERKMEFDTKMSRINDFVMSTFEDDVGMPPVTLDSYDSDMRGIPNCSSTDDGYDDIPDSASQGDTVVHLY